MRYLPEFLQTHKSPIIIAVEGFASVYFFFLKLLFESFKQALAYLPREGYGMSSDSKINVSRMMRGDGGPAKQAPTPLATPTLVSPVEGQHFPPYPRTLTLSWKAVQYATGYIVTVQFYSNSSNGKVWLTKPPVNTSATSVTVDFPANIPGRWCVSAVDSTSMHTASSNSAYRNFDFTVLVLDTPVLVSPLNGQVFANYPRKTILVWQPVAGATRYFVTVDACNSGKIVTPTSTWQNVLKGTVQTNSITFDFVGAQPGRWSVFAIDSTNGHQQSAASAWSNFTYTI